MNTAAQNQTNEEILVTVHQTTATPVKCCINCKTELIVNNDIRHTTFGLDLCADCLYT